MSSAFIGRTLQSEIFTPPGGARPGREHIALVIGLGVGSVLRRPDGGLSDGGRYARTTAARLGVTACAFPRLGVNGGHSPREMRDIYRALDPSNGNYQQTMYDIGHVLRGRILDHNAGLTPVVNGHSGGAIAGAALVSHNTLGASGAVLTEPAAIHNFAKPFAGFRAFKGWLNYQLQVEGKTVKTKPEAETVHADPSFLRTNARTIKDMVINARVGSTSQVLDDLRTTTVPTAVEFAEHGLYSQILDLRDVAQELTGSNPGTVHASVRPDVTHAWYDATDHNAQAIAEGLYVIGLLPDSSINDRFTT